jgi:hypothetical protein
MSRWRTGLDDGRDDPDDESVSSPERTVETLPAWIEEP